MCMKYLCAHLQPDQDLHLSPFCSNTSHYFLALSTTSSHFLGLAITIIILSPCFRSTPASHTRPNSTSSTWQLEPTDSFPVSDEYAFNTAITAYDHGIGDLGQPIWLGFQRPMPKKDGSTTATPPSLVPTPGEKDFDSAPCKGFFVGMWPRLAPDFAYDKKQTRLKDQEAAPGISVTGTVEAGRGACVSMHNACYTLTLDPDALRVIAVYGNTNASYYVLVNQDAQTGLCEGRPVPIDEIFFFKLYRKDNIAAYSHRKKEWPHLVGLHLADKEEDMAGGSALQKPSSPAVILAYVKMYRENEDKSMLRKALERLDEQVAMARGNTDVASPAAINESTPQQSSFHAFVISELGRLRQIRHDHRLKIRALTDGQGDQMVPMSLPLIMQNFATRPDVDSARLYCSQIQRYNANALADLMTETDTALTQRIDELDDLEKKLTQAEA